MCMHRMMKYRKPYTVGIWQKKHYHIYRNTLTHTHSITYLYTCVITHSFCATKIYFSEWWLTLSSSIRRKACLSPAVDTAHVALATVSCSPKVCLGKVTPGCIPMSSISTTALEKNRSWRELKYVMLEWIPNNYKKLDAKYMFLSRKTCIAH